MKTFSFVRLVVVAFLVRCFFWGLVNLDVSAFTPKRVNCTEKTFWSRLLALTSTKVHTYPPTRWTRVLLPNYCDEML